MQQLAGDSLILSFVDSAPTGSSIGTLTGRTMLRRGDSSVRAARAVGTVRGDQGQGQSPSPASSAPAPVSGLQDLLAKARDTLRRDVIEFCLLTGLHGYKYIAQPGKHSFERLFWLAVVTVSMGAAGYFMVQAYAFNRAHQTLLAVDTTHHPLWRVHVPAVTVCPNNKVLRYKALRLVRSLRSLPPGVNEDDVLEDMALLSELILPHETNGSRFERLQSVLDLNDIKVDQLMKMVSPTCDELLVRCVWKRRECTRCSELFRRVRTAFGYCCSFNYIDRALGEYRPQAGRCLRQLPDVVQRVSACGSRNGLSVVARVQPQEYVTSLSPSHAVMVLIHDALQFPDDNAHMKVVGTGSVALISYIAEVMEATPRLKLRLPPSVRKCLFTDETYLPMYRDYTFANCMASCRANRTMGVCGCVPLTFPYVLNRTICNLLTIPCQSSMAFSPVNITTCPRCLPRCEHTQYIVKSSYGELSVDAAHRNIAGTVDPSSNYLIEHITDSLDEHAVIHVYPRHAVTTRYKMDVHLQREDLVGTLGGLSGLFVGFSLVAGFECVYFFTIRPCFRQLSSAESSSGKGGDPEGKAANNGTAAAARPTGAGLAVRRQRPIAPFVLVPPRNFKEDLLPPVKNP